VTTGATITANKATTVGDNNFPAVVGTSFTLNSNAQKVNLGVQNKVLSSTATFLNTADMQFSSKITLTGEWIFDGDAYVSGNGNILDLSLGGTIRIKDNTVLNLSSMKLRGLGIGSIIFEDPTSQLNTSMLEIEMNRNYSFTTGSLYANGPTNIVTKNNILDISQASILTVDGIALTYDTTTFTDQQNIRGNITLLNDGIVRHLSNTDIISQTSNAIVSLAKCCKNNSNAIIKLDTTVRTDSNAFAFGIKNNSNTLLYFFRTDSNTILSGILDNSNAIIKLDRTVRTDSNAFAYGIKNNSNAIVALAECCLDNSNAIVNLNNIIRNSTNSLSTLIRATSNASLYCCRVNSNALVYGINNNSNALLYGIHNNSTAIVNLNNIVRNSTNSLSTLIRATSNASLYCCRVNSNALLYGIKNNSNALAYGIHNNSTAIVWLDIQLQTIDHGPLPVDINQTTTSLSFDIWLSREHKMFVNVDSTLDGHGHFIHFSHDGTDLLNIADGKTLVLKNVVLKGLTEDDLGLGAGSHIIFGDGTLVSLFADPDLNMTWTFQGQTILNGSGEELKLKSQGNIFVTGTGSSLLFENIVVSGVAGNNIRCMDDSCTFSFYNTTLILDDTYSLTTGKFEVLSTLDIVGSWTFNYATQAQSIIQPNGTLLLDMGSIFNYAPISNNRDLLSMADVTSRLYMNGATVASTTTGLRLTNGMLIIDKENFLRNDGAVALSQGISFGNNSAINDLSITIIPGANINVLSGIVNYENVN